MVLIGNVTPRPVLALCWSLATKTSSRSGMTHAFGLKAHTTCTVQPRCNQNKNNKLDSPVITNTTNHPGASGPVDDRHDCVTTVTGARHMLSWHGQKLRPPEAAVTSKVAACRLADMSFRGIQAHHADVSMQHTLGHLRLLHRSLVCGGQLYTTDCARVTEQIKNSCWAQQQRWQKQICNRQNIRWQTPHHVLWCLLSFAMTHSSQHTRWRQDTTVQKLSQSADRTLGQLFTFKHRPYYCHFHQTKRHQKSQPQQPEVSQNSRLLMTRGCKSRVGSSSYGQSSLCHRSTTTSS